MSVSVTCPQCGTVSQAPDDLVGKMGRCSKCQTRFPIHADPVVVTTLAPLPAMPPPVPQPAVGLDMSDKPKPAAPSGPPPEPWYYEFLIVYAGFGMVLGVFQFLLFGLKALGDFAEATKPDTPGPSLLPLGFSFVAMILAIAGAATIFLAVDAARHLRAIRFRPASPLQSA